MFYTALYIVCFVSDTFVLSSYRVNEARIVSFVCNTHKYSSAEKGSIICQELYKWMIWLYLNYIDEFK